METEKWNDNCEKYEKEIKKKEREIFKGEIDLNNLGKITKKIINFAQDEIIKNMLIKK